MISEHKDVLSQLKNMESTIHECRAEIVGLKVERDEQKQKLTALSDEHVRCQSREKAAYTKLNEAIQVVETAIVEKNAALQREKELRGKFRRIFFYDSLLLNEKN